MSITFIIKNDIFLHPRLPLMFYFYSQCIMFRIGAFKTLHFATNNRLIFKVLCPFIVVLFPVVVNVTKSNRECDWDSTLNIFNPNLCNEE